MTTKLAEVNPEQFGRLQELMLKSEMQGNSNRPRIAWLMAILVALFYIFYLCVMTYGVVKGDSELPTWEEIGIILALPTYILKTYFTVRSEDKRARNSVAMGINPNTPTIAQAVVGKLTSTTK